MFRQQSTAVSENAENERLPLVMLVTGNPPLLYWVLDSMQEQNWVCFWTYRNFLPHLLSVSTEKPRIALFINGYKSWAAVLNFDLIFCRMLLRSCKCVCHECKCINVSVPFLPSMFPQRIAVMTRRVTVEVCILVFVLDLCKSIIQLCTGVTCRYQVRVFIQKK